MIRDEAAYRRQAEHDARADPHGLTVEESIASGESLLTFEAVRMAASPADFCRFAFSLLEGDRPASSSSADRMAVHSGSEGEGGRVRRVVRAE